MSAPSGRPELVELYPTSAIRVENRDRVNLIVAEWIGGHTLDQVIAKTRAGGVPCAEIYSIREIFKDPQYAARGNLQRVQDPRVGELVVPAAIPRMSRTPPKFRHTGRPLGADNQQIYRELLGLSESELQAHRAAGVV